MSYQYDANAAHDILVIKGVTDNSGTTGAGVLTCPEMYSTALTYLEIPDGCEVQLLEMRIVNGAAVGGFTIDVSYDAGSNWKEVYRMIAAASSEDDTTFRTPKKIRAIHGNERIRLAWSQASAVVSYCIITVRICPITAD